MRDKRILIIDDEKRMADSLRDLLGGLGYHVQTAYSGPEGIDALNHCFFHVVVTDLRMHGVGGMDIIRHVHEHFPRTLIIVITGHASTESAIEAVHYQVFDYLRKPFEFDLFRMAIEKAFQKLETEQLREDTAAMITHDIKIPLTSIIGFASMLHDRDKQAMHPRAAEFSETILANGQKILTLIDNYLTTCKIEAGTLKISPALINLPQILQDAVDSFLPEAERHGHQVLFKIEAGLDAAELDELLVYRAFGNLLINALKYSSEQSPIYVYVRLMLAAESPLTMDSLLIQVINHSPHVQPEDLVDVFQRYKRANKSPGVEGSGIGLYVVASVAQAHGGLVRAELLENQHVCFSMILPLQPVAKVPS